MSVRNRLPCCLLLVFCGLTQDALGEPDYSRPGIPDAGWVDIYFDGFDLVADSAGLEPLRLMRLPDDKREVRIWIGGGHGYPQSMYRLTVEEGEVDGAWIWHWPIRGYLEADDGHGFHDLMRYIHRGSCEDFRRIDKAGTCRVILDPEPSWAELLHEAEQAGLWTLPDSSALPPSRSMTLDGWSLTVELLDGHFYRTYHYGNPQHKEWPEARRAERIAQTFRSLKKRVPSPDAENVYVGTMESFGRRLKPCDGSDHWFTRSHLSAIVHQSLLVLPRSESSTYIVKLRAIPVAEWLVEERDYGSRKVLERIELLSVHAVSDTVCSGL